MNCLYEVAPVGFQNKEHAAFWEDFLTETEILQLLAQPEWSTSAPANIVIAPGVEGENQDVRESHVSWLYPGKATSHIWDKISKVASYVNAQHFGLDLNGFYEPAQLTTYFGSANGKYNWHIDYLTNATKHPPRKLSMVLMLSNPGEDFAGGELQIKANDDNPISLQQKRGRAWFFPSYLLHRVAPVTSGIRKSMVLWIGGPDFK